MNWKDLPNILYPNYFFESLLEKDQLQTSASCALKHLSSTIKESFTHMAAISSLVKGRHVTISHTKLKEEEKGRKREQERERKGERGKY